MWGLSPSFRCAGRLGRPSAGGSAAPASAFTSPCAGPLFCKEPATRDSGPPRARGTAPRLRYLLLRRPCLRISQVAVSAAGGQRGSAWMWGRPATPTRVRYARRGNGEGGDE